MQNWSETLLSQYDDSPTIQGLIESFNDAVDPSTDLQNVYTYLWNIATAVGQGLDNWGQIVGVSRNLTVTASQTYLGFVEAQTSTYSPASFGNAPMYPGFAATQTLTLTDDAYRQLIFVKAAANIAPLTAQSMNSLLCSALGLSKSAVQRAYVQDSGEMSQRYLLEFQPTDYQVAVLANSGVIPRSAGAMVWLVIVPSGTFGFAEAGGTPFGYGTLFPPSGLQNAS